MDETPPVPEWESLQFESGSPSSRMGQWWMAPVAAAIVILVGLGSVVLGGRLGEMLRSGGRWPRHGRLVRGSERRPVGRPGSRRDLATYRWCRRGARTVRRGDLGGRVPAGELPADCEDIETAAGAGPINEYARSLGGHNGGLYVANDGALVLQVVGDPAPHREAIRRARPRSARRGCRRTRRSRPERRRNLARRGRLRLGSGRPGYPRFRGTGRSSLRGPLLPPLAARLPGRVHRGRGCLLRPTPRRGPGILGGEVEQTALLGPHHREEQHGRHGEKGQDSHGATVRET